MPKRNTYRPRIWDVLEDRTLPSHGGLAHHHPPVTVGALGDSYTDEYQFYAPHRSSARSWVEILAATRPVRFGGFTTDFQDDVRQQGYEFNWAKGGATSTDMVRDQLPGLAAQVHQGQVKYAWIFIGSNDFNSFLFDAAGGQAPTATILARLAHAEARLETNFTRAVNRLLAANRNVKIVVSTLFDLSMMPSPSFANPAAQPLLNAVNDAIHRFNDLVRSTAAGNGRIALVDVAGMMAQLAQQAGPADSIPFGGTAIAFDRPGDDIHHAFLADRIHFGTVVQGMIANGFIDAIDALGAQVARLSERQIVRFARHAEADS
jgi:lysophospholipase L1-like esterase